MSIAAAQSNTYATHREVASVNQPRVCCEPFLHVLCGLERDLTTFFKDRLHAPGEVKRVREEEDVAVEAGEVWKLLCEYSRQMLQHGKGDSLRTNVRELMVPLGEISLPRVIEDGLRISRIARLAPLQHRMQDERLGLRDRG